MPFAYHGAPGANHASHATANTEIESMFVKPGAGRAMWLMGLMAAGKAAAETALSAFVIRVKRWDTTASAGGTAVTFSPADPGAQAAKATGAQATAGVTPGTGGPTNMQIAIGFGLSGANGWVARDIDSAPVLEAAATKSFGLFNSCGAVSKNFEITNVEIRE